VPKKWLKMVLNKDFAFLSLIRAKDFLFGGKELLFFKISKLMFVVDTFVSLQKILTLYDDRIKNILYFVAKESTKSIVSQEIKQFGYKRSTHLFERMLKQFEYTGIGKSKILRLDIEKGVIKIRNPNCVFAKRFRRMCGFQSQPIDFYICGIYTGIAEAVFQTEFIGIEESCIACLAPACIFNIYATKKIPDRKKLENGFMPDKSRCRIDIDIIKEATKFENMLEKRKTSRLNSITERFIRTNKMVYKDGTIKVLGGYIFLIPLNNIILIQKLLEKDSRICEALYFVGKMQTITAANIMKKRFGFENILKLFAVIFRQSELIGFGDFKMLKSDTKKKYALAQSINNKFSLQYFKLFGKQDHPVDYLLSGMGAGIAEVLVKERMVLIQKCCIAQQSPSCVFETFEEKKIDSFCNPQQKLFFRKLNEIENDIKNKINWKNFYKY